MTDERIIEEATNLLAGKKRYLVQRKLTSAVVVWAIDDDEIRDMLDRGEIKLLLDDEEETEDMWWDVASHDDLIYYDEHS